MLCNRPAEPSSQPHGPGRQHLSPQIDAPSFRPVGLPPEPLGLNPAKENLISNVIAVHEEAARRRLNMPHPPGPPNVLSKHRAWLAEMARKKAALNTELHASATAAASKRTKFVSYTKAMREAVRSRQAEIGHTGKLPFDREEEGGGGEGGRGGEEEEKELKGPKVVREAEAVEGKPKPSSKDASKPRWALTEEKAEAVEEEEADALVDFANKLDYDQYIDDLEVCVRVRGQRWEDGELGGGGGWRITGCLRRDLGSRIVVYPVRSECDFGSCVRPKDHCTRCTCQVPFVLCICSVLCNLCFSFVPRVLVKFLWLLYTCSVPQHPLFFIRTSVCIWLGYIPPLYLFCIIALNEHTSPTPLNQYFSRPTPHSRCVRPSP